MLKGHVPVCTEFAQLETPPPSPSPPFKPPKSSPSFKLSQSLLLPLPPHPLQGSSLVLSGWRRANAEGQGHGPRPDQSLPGGKKMRSVPWIGERIHQKIAAEKEPEVTAHFSSLYVRPARAWKYKVLKFTLKTVCSSECPDKVSRHPTPGPGPSFHTLYPYSIRYPLLTLLELHKERKIHYRQNWA